MSVNNAEKNKLHDVINAASELPEGTLPEDVVQWIIKTAEAELHALIVEETLRGIEELNEGFNRAYEQERRRNTKTGNMKHRISPSRFFR